MPDEPAAYIRVHQSVYTCEHDIDLAYIRFHQLGYTCDHDIDLAYIRVHQSGYTCDHDIDLDIVCIVRYRTLPMLDIVCSKISHYTDAGYRM